MGYLKNIKDNFKLKHYTNYILIIAALILFVTLSSVGVLGRSNLGLLHRIAYSIVLAVSLNLVVGFLGELSLGHAGFMCVGAYIGCYFAITISKFIANPLIVIVLSMLVGGLIAAVFGFIIGLPALRLKGDYLAIVTLAFGEIVRNVFKNLQLFGGARGMQTSAISYNAKKLYIISFVVVLVMLFLVQNLIRSKHGRAITAIRDNEIAARAMGINVTYYKLFVFVISAFFAGVAGVMYGFQVSPNEQSFFSYNYSIEILVMVVLGGMGNIGGSIIAAALLTYVNFFLQDQLTGSLAALKLLIYAIILILVVVFSNAPALKPLRERFNLKALVRKITKSHKKPDHVADDEAEWNRVETKIKMDELLSVDFQNSKAYTPDRKSKKEDK
jgi:branched-chain amino acid transport system permease protein